MKFGINSYKEYFFSMKYKFNLDISKYRLEIERDRSVDLHDTFKNHRSQ